jgi:DNA mismatch repair protein MutS
MDHYLMTNPLCGLYITEDTDGICAGFATIGALGMSSWVCEIASDATHPYASIDKILHLFFVASVKKIVIGTSSLALYETVKHHFESFDVLFESTPLTSNDLNELFENVFSLRSLLNPIDHLSLEESQHAAMALGLLALHVNDSSFLPFIAPTVLRMDGLLQMGNNPLEQLEMVSHDEREFSIAKLFLKMRTFEGQQLGRFRFGLPITDIDELNERYAFIEKLRSHCDFLDQELALLPNIAQAWSVVRLHKFWDQQAQNLCEALERLALMHEYLDKYNASVPLIGASIIRDWCCEFRNNYNRPQWLREQNAFISSLLLWIAQIDVAVTSALVVKRYGLRRPTLVKTRENESFMQVMGLRHLLVEAQGNEYVPNDIVMGNRDYLDMPYPDTVMLNPRVHDGADINGVLLYGINSSGKSSLMKSIGIAVVLAQGGFFVPAKVMKFSPFDALFTRILSRDNVVKSLSTFGVEMLELNSIFHKVTSKTLVLGDEISHGTETLSAVAIVASTILELARQKPLFILTTHLHQLSIVQELTQLRNVVNLHLSVHYDGQNDRLVYDRVLRAGRGSSVYGLEFAQSLHMHEGFLANAKRIRENLASEFDGLELRQQLKSPKAKSMYVRL